MSMQFPGGNGQGPVLSDNMPKLSSGLSRGVNKTAVAYIVIVSLATIGMTLWVASNALSANDDKKTVKYEEVTVPDKPVLKLAPPPVDVVAKNDLPPLPAEMPQQGVVAEPKPRPPPPRVPSPQEACADANFLARPMCIHQECQKPSQANQPICVENRRRYEADEQRRRQTPN